MKTSKTFLIFFIGFGLFLGSCQSSGKKDKSMTRETDRKGNKPLNTLTEAEKADGWNLLFDGENPGEHWRSYCQETFPDKGWTVENEAIKVISAGDGGDIITKQKYSDFELQLEWKVEKGGNSGIFYLAEEQCGENEKAIWMSAPEMQILDNKNHPDAKKGKNGNRQAGSLYDMIPADPQNAKPHGEWNKVRISVDQGTVSHFQNGEKVLEYHLWTDDWKQMVVNSKFTEYPGFVDVAKEGYIGLQDHGNDVWFRNIKIKDMTN